ncbi:4-hydroxy-3-methylbut-2-enyl diphosphate reductase [Helicobacter monodelphidis]|uniref:4-hydroxy-3-methylbut-2-enyl diphosphate reductase n=1 Tax=Helicobacter sp. 15-1451 TaxID=2004995 RepID=UPI000DCC1AEF|nr:4-hydroxy-3-methylbut-2-enyl diphosphate reductase [Helicobacter sp. 15-1451]RAX58858.1 4-hydroxy-3-methylbut-2-enyl diphosphate reductase [Helicobacter sp. 15-1451]
MIVKKAKNLGFCFGVKRAIRLAESKPGGITLGSLIHNPKEINRLKSDYGVSVCESVAEIPNHSEVIIRTHGIPKKDLEKLRLKSNQITDATCPFVTKPQQICEQMSKEGYQVIIFGDESHPEVKGVMSYSMTPVLVVGNLEELKKKSLSEKIALVSQTTKKISEFLNIADYLVRECTEVRIFNTICNATFDNQEAARELSCEVEVMIIVGGKNSSNTKQLLSICQEHCDDSYLIEDENELQEEWFLHKKICGVTAGASTPDWIIQNVVAKIEAITPI